MMNLYDDCSAVVFTKAQLKCRRSNWNIKTIVNT